MDFKNLMDRAKDAATAAANKASEAAASLTTTAPQPQAPAPEVAAPEDAQAEGEQAVVVVTTTTEQTVVTTAPAKSFGAIASEKITQISQAGSDKIQELVGSFQKALPALKSAGYEITEFEVELGVTPKLIPHFKHAPKSAEDIEAAKEMLKDNKLGQILLGALLKAGDVHKQIKVAGFGFSHIEIEMGLIPSVRLQYKKD